MQASLRASPQQQPCRLTGTALKATKPHRLPSRGPTTHAAGCKLGQSVATFIQALTRERQPEAAVPSFVRRRSPAVPELHLAAREAASTAAAVHESAAAVDEVVGGPAAQEVAAGWACLGHGAAASVAADAAALVLCSRAEPDGSAHEADLAAVAGGDLGSWGSLAAAPAR